MPLLSVENLQTSYRTSRGTLRAVDGVSLSVEAGETVALVGESGCGKSSLGRTILGLTPHSGGRVRFDGVDITALGRTALRPYRRRMQMVFQDPSASLNPRQTGGTLLSTPLAVHRMGTREEQRARVVAMAERVERGI